MGSDFNRTVGQKLYEARKAKGYSRAKVGELVGLHETTVKRYEDGDIKSLDIERLKDFARVLGTPAADLLGWISNSDDNLELMLQLSKESQSGRTKAQDEMFRLFGTEHSTNSIRLVGDKTAMLYYKAMDRNSAVSLNDIISTVQDLDQDALENIRLVVLAYLHADAPIREIVDTALKPYKEKETIDAMLSQLG